jgi:hypothetical protein
MMDKHDSVTFNQAWLCEAIHLKESQWGPLDDSKARLLAQNEHSPRAKIIRRAKELTQSSGLTTAITTLRSAGWLSCLVILSLAIIAGASSAFATLGNGSQPVNIVWALLSLLGLNFLSLIIWIVTLLSPTASGGRLAQLWPWLTRKIARGPDIGLAVQAWWSVWHHAHATRWLLSAGTHLIWMILLLAATAATLFALSTGQYDFVWETTVLSSEVFVKGVGRLAVIPQWLGFPVPDPELVRASSSVSHSSADVTRRLWSGWLLGCLIIYGVLPRFFLWLLSTFIVLRRRAHIEPDLTSPYYVAVLSRMHSTNPHSTDAPPPASVFKIDAKKSPYSSNTFHTEYLLIAIEPDPHDSWPPEGIGSIVTCVGPIDSRESRQHVLGTIAQTRPRNLVLVCDARHSPDRGTLRLITDLSECANKTLIWLRHSQASNAHTEAWRTQLRDHTTLELKIQDDAASVMQWLERHHD